MLWKVVSCTPLASLPTKLGWNKTSGQRVWTATRGEVVSSPWPTMASRSWRRDGASLRTSRTQAIPLKTVTTMSSFPLLMASSGAPRPASERNTPKECLSVTGKSCVFPFSYQGTTYGACTQAGSENGAAWCATEVDENGEVVRNTWEDCDLACPQEGTVPA